MTIMALHPTTVCAVAFLFYGCCASSHSDNQFPKSNTENSKNVTFMENILKKIEGNITELQSLHLTSGIPSSGQVWHGEEYASATFVLRRNIRYHPATEFPREKALVPYVDLFVTITRYPSPGAIQTDLEKSLRMRPAMPKSKEKYRGATLYRWIDSSGEMANLVCQCKLYIVEISPNSGNANRFVMDVLNIILAEINSTSIGSK